MERTVDPPDLLVAAAEAGRLAAGRGTDAVQRRRADGGLDVVVFEKGRLHVYRVDADGRSTLCETHRRVPRSVWFRRSVATAIGVFLIALPVSAFSPEAAGAAAVAAFALFFGAGVAFGNTSVHDGLKAARWDAAEWDYVPEIIGLSPGTSTQMDIAQRLAKEHDNHAFARPLGDRTTEVVATSGGQLFRYIVGADGSVTMVEKSPVRVRFYVGAAFIVVCVILFIGIFVLAAIGVHDARIPITFGAMFASMIIGHAFMADTRAQRIAEPRDAWLEVTVPEESSE